MKTTNLMLVVSLMGLAACKTPPENMEGNLVMNPVQETGYTDLEIKDDATGVTKMLPAGRYRMSLKTAGKATMSIADLQGQTLATVSLKDAKFRDHGDRFFMAAFQNTKQALDIYGGRKKNILHRKRVGKPDVMCTISCCTTHQDCTTDSNGHESCTTVCDDCTGHQDELWEENTYRYDYEIFFGKPGDYEVGSFIAKGETKTEQVRLNSESCH